MDKTTYYWLNDRKTFGRETKHRFYLWENGMWVKDSDWIILGKLIGYDSSEPDWSPYATGSTSVMDTIEISSKKEFKHWLKETYFDINKKL